YGCSSLTSITLPEGLTSIETFAFSGCTSLTSITLPEGLTSIGDYAFFVCRSLVEVSFLGNAPALVGTNHFSGLPPEARVYYQAGTSGWGIEFGGIPTVQVTLNFSDWIGGYPGVGAETGVGADPDRDGIPSGLENFFGTDPSVFSAGMVVVGKSGTTLTLSHPKAASSAPDLTVVYEWSSDMTVFYPAGSSNAAGTTTVNFTPSKDNPGTTTVTAQISGSVIPKKVFVRLSVREVDEM
ncbi:leucine-rich repeat domain-containing protein, partial [Haloferula sp.]|uniref:leucine-rich repeat domain-containing protein n=1 Tax=Haloferula sp. TaxID=2497595 RepID=UPI003C711429